MHQRKLPIGIQNFEELRTENNLYIDKTEYIHRLVSSNKYYFLSRPRRFGKSLLLSTLKAYFQGKKELFLGLKIYELEKEWKEYPIFYFDFVNITSNNQTVVENVTKELNRSLIEYEKNLDITPIDDDPFGRLLGLLKESYKKTGKKSVILIDEYDKPLTESMQDPKMYQSIKDILRSFYSILKKGGEFLHFVMLTGVTKFSGISIFSDLNNLKDISFREDFSNICGITKKELIYNLQPEIITLAKYTDSTYEQTIEKLHEYYDGYHFATNSDGIFNPFSLLNCLDAKSFEYYWFKTGSPTFLIKEMLDQSFDITKLTSGLAVSKTGIEEYQIGGNNLSALLYQTGYLTIKSLSEYDNYLLEFPNKEVKLGFFDSLLNYTVSNSFSNEFYFQNFINDLKIINIESFMTRLKAYFANIPYSNVPLNEYYYRDILFCLFNLMGLNVRTEIHSALGRSDIVLELPNVLYLFEIKRTANDSKELLDIALNQIDEKGYLTPHLAKNKKLIKVAAIFSNEIKTLTSWKWKEF